MLLLCTHTHPLVSGGVDYMAVVVLLPGYCLAGYIPLPVCTCVCVCVRERETRCSSWKRNKQAYLIIIKECALVQLFRSRHTYHS